MQRRVTGKIAVLLFMILGVLASQAFAADTLTAFNTTIQKLEVSKDGGSTFFTIFDNNSAAVDLVALNGQSVGTFMGEAQCSEGTYNYYRVSITSVSLTFTVDGSGETSGSTNLSSSTTGTLTRDLASFCCPRTESGSINVQVIAGKITNGVINFDAATSFSGLTYIDNDGAGAGTTVTFTGINFAPVVTVTT